MKLTPLPDDGRKATERSDLRAEDRCCLPAGGVPADQALAERGAFIKIVPAEPELVDVVLRALAVNHPDFYYPDLRTHARLVEVVRSAGLGFFYCRRELVERVWPTQTGWFADENIFAMDHTDYSPARTAPKGLPRVWALCDHKLDYLERQVFPGGCFFAATSVEFSHRPGPVRDRIEDMLRSWLSYLEHAVEQAQQAGELDWTLSAREITFELDSFAMAANWQYHLFGDASVFDAARRAVRERLESLRPAA